MLAAGGYPWLVIPLEAASVGQDTVLFTKFLAELLTDQR